MVHCLLMAYDLDINMDCVEPKMATADELSLFHSLYYLNYLRDECINRNEETDSDDSDDVDDEQLNYGLGTIVV